MDKALLRRRDGRTVLAALLAAPVDGRRVVVGPERDVAGVDVWAREGPAGWRPVAAMAPDSPTSPRRPSSSSRRPAAGADAVPALLAALDHHDVAALEAGGRRQWLLAAWRTAALRDAVTRLGDPAGARVRALYDGVDVARVPEPEGAQWSGDLDTAADLGRLRD